jgi:hypothetical protein
MLLKITLEHLITFIELKISLYVAQIYNLEHIFMLSNMQKEHRYQSQILKKKQAEKPNF